ncbi:MAG: MFS transporter [Parasporobacterium sp.]|nr:MFS transporter [Parasporobacterium sp.]
MAEKRVRTVLVVAVICFCSLLHSIATFKLLPMQAILKGFFDINDAQYGVMNSLASLPMIALSIPFGFIARKFPPKFTFMVGYAVGIAGMIVQAITANFTVFIIGKMLEGVGFGMATLVTNSLLVNVVGSKAAGLWMSIAVAITIVAQVITTKVGTALLYDAGMHFQTFFWGLTALQGIAVIVWLVFIPKDIKIYGNQAATKPTKEQTKRVITNKDNWMVAIGMALFNAVSIAFPSYIIQYWVGRGMAQTEAANTLSITSLISIGAMFVFGILSDRLGTKKKIVIFSFCAAVVALVLLAVLPVNLMWIYIVLYGTLPRSIAGLSNASAVDIAEVPSDVPVVNSVKNTITQVLGFFLTFALGYMIEYLGYVVTIFILAGFMAVGAILWACTKRIP